MPKKKMSSACSHGRVKVFASTCNPIRFRSGCFWVQIGLFLGPDGLKIGYRLFQRSPRHYPAAPSLHRPTVQSTGFLLQCRFIRSDWRSLFHVKFSDFHRTCIQPTSITFILPAKHFSYIPHSCHDLLPTRFELFLGHFQVFFISLLIIRFSTDILAGRFRLPPEMAPLPSSCCALAVLNLASSPAFVMKP